MSRIALVFEELTALYTWNEYVCIQRVFYVRLTLGFFTWPWHGIHFAKSEEILSSKTWWEPKTVIFPQLKAMRKLSTDYSSLWLIPAASMSYSWRSICHQLAIGLFCLYPVPSLVLGIFCPRRDPPNIFGIFVLGNHIKNDYIGQDDDFSSRHIFLGLK